LHELLDEHANRIVNGMVATLQRTSNRHYRQLEAGVLRDRVVSLVAAFADAISADNPGLLVAHVRTIVDSRISEGFGLDEIQLALTALEERIWGLVTAEVPLARQVDQLRRASITIGMTKDQLAQMYLRQTVDAEARVARLEHKLEQLFQGTEPAPLRREEDEEPDPEAG